MELNYKHEDLIDEQGRQRTISLFWELRAQAPNHTPYFTTKDRDIVREGVPYLSLKRIYLSYDHIPGYEYDFAQDVFGSWKHWLKMCKTGAGIREHIASWREELEVRIKARALKNMMEASLDNDAKGVNAAKWLAESGYKPKDKKGRPSKADIAAETKQQAAVNKTLQDDMERIGIKVVK